MATVTRLKFPQSEPAAEPAGFVLPGEATDLLDPRRLFGALRRRKVLIGGVMALVTGLTTLFVNQIVPQYRTQAMLVVQSSHSNLAGFETVAQGITPDFYTNETEAAIVRSRALAAKAVDRLNLYAHPLFNPELRPRKAGILELATATVRHWLGRETDAEMPVEVPASPPPPAPRAAMSPEDKRAADREWLTDAYLSGLVVLPSDRSRVLIVEYVSTDPQFAALAANATAEIYIQDQVATKGEATSRASTWLNQRAVELRERVIEADRRLEEYRRSSGIIDLGGTNVVQEQAGKLNTELLAISAKRAEAEARHQQVQALLNNPGGVETAAAVLDSPLIQRLREQEIGLQRKIAELRTQLRDGHPRLILAHNELANLMQKVSAEVAKIAVNLGNEMEIARVREQNLRAELAKVELKLQKQNQADVTLKTLISEAHTNKQLYETVLTRFKQSDVVDDEPRQADARIISRAVVPEAPFYPQKRLMILAALVVSGVLAVALALLLEFLDTGFRTLTQMEAATGLPVLGSVPALIGAQDRRTPHRVAIHRPSSAYGEAIRSLRTSLLLSDTDRAPRTILVTSAISGEGKTTISTSLATQSARSGQRAILVDCDLRQPNVHAVLDHPNTIGLTEFLSGQARLDEVVEIDAESGVHFIVAGGRAPHPADLLGSRKMRDLLQTLSESYEIVVLDTPPLLAVSDALVMVRHVDKTVFVVRWEKTARDTAIAGLKQVMETGADFAGMVLTMVDIRKNARYGYSDTGYHDYQRVNKYYSD